MKDCIDSFLSAASRQGSLTAVSLAGQHKTYAQLEKRVRQIAAKVAGHDQPRALIALPQGFDAYAAMLGVAMGGGYYAPLNLSAPIEKIERIVKSFRPDVILASPEWASVLHALIPKAETIAPDEIDTLPPLAGRGLRHNRAYVIFTSGSTGQPKGVVISRAALDHYVAWLTTALIRPEDIVSQHPNIAFDLSVMDIYGALCAGATLCPLTSPSDRLMPALAIARERITVWISVPSVIRLMARAAQATAENLCSVRLFAFCGEALLAEHLQTIFSARPDAEVVNTYGPTETTVSMTSLTLTRENYETHCSGNVAIGAPIPGMAISLVGGETANEGQIVISGPQLADAYWEEPEQTARAFQTIAVEGRSRRGYFTGDWAQRIGDDLYFRNRMDFQVKVRGLRLELEEVASAMRALGWAGVCVVLVEREIVAAIECDDDAFDEAAIRRALSTKLEAHAIPTHIFKLSAFPRNDNDKIDRAAVEQQLKSLIHT